jgi:PIN domain nuclease of toxin-antitoxin system
VLVWEVAGDRRISPAIRALIDDPANEVWVSTVSLWELAVKTRAGKLRTNLPQLERALAAWGAKFLDLRSAHVHALAALPVFPDHKDPFDHLLVAQAVVEQAIFVSTDRHASRYPVQHMPA